MCTALWTDYVAGAAQQFLPLALRPFAAMSATGTAGTQRIIVDSDNHTLSMSFDEKAGVQSVLRHSLHSLLTVAQSVQSPQCGSCRAVQRCSYVRALHR